MEVEIQKPKYKRGAGINPMNRFESTSTNTDWTDFEYVDELPPETQNVKTEVIIDHAKSIVTKNNSPDVGFQFSINPYRGCEHGCSYCYARPTHETLGMNAGLDFESKILVKENAPDLLRKDLAKKSWTGAVVAMSGVTDCYQPLERRFKLTRGCLAVLLEHGNPAVIISKNILMLRDLDILKPMAEKRLIHIYLSVTTLDEKLAAAMEPRTAIPKARLKAVEVLKKNGIPVSVMMAPMIPGLNDMEIPAVLKAAKEAGAHSAHYVVLRLPLNVRPIFLDWLSRNFPEKYDRVCSLIEGVRDGKMNDASFGSRMRGKGEYAQMIATTFKIFQRKYGLDQKSQALDTNRFRRPNSSRDRLLFPEEA